MKALKFTMKIIDDWIKDRNYVYYVRCTKSNKDYLQDIIDNSPYYFVWIDGKTMEISVEIQNVKRPENHFPGYEWAVKSILKNRKITTK